MEIFFIFHLIKNTRKYGRRSGWNPAYRSSHRRRSILKNFAIFTENHLSWRVLWLSCRTWRPFKNTYFGEHLPNAASETIIENGCFWNYSETAYLHPLGQVCFCWSLQNVSIIKPHLPIQCHNSSWLNILNTDTLLFNLYYLWLNNKEHKTWDKTETKN